MELNKSAINSHSMRIRVENDDHPNLLSFPAGVPIDYPDLQLEISEKGSGKKRRRHVNAELNGITYQSSNYGENSSKNDCCRYLVGSYDGSTGVLSVYPSDHVYVMRPQLVGRKDVLRDSSMLSYLEKRQSLTEEFGSRKKKRALHASQSNIILTENISGAQAVENAMTSQVVEDIDDSVEFVEAAAVALEENRVKLLPPFNASAETVEEAFPVSGLLPGVVATALQELYDSILTDEFQFPDIAEEDGGTPVKSSKKHSRENVMRHWEKYFGTGQPAVISTGLLTAMPLSNGPTLKSSQRKAMKSTLCLVLQLHFAIRFHQKLANSGFHEASRDDLKAALGNVPHAVFKYFCDQYARYTKKGGVPTFAVSKANLDKLAIYIIVLALTLSSFSVDLSSLAQDLKMAPASLLTLAKEVGCQIRKQSVSNLEASEDVPGASGGAVGGQYTAFLEVPLKFPALRKGGKGKGGRR